jgi:hypothetical protein
VDRYAISTESAIRITVVAMLGHKNSVWVSGIRPLMLNNVGGIADLVAIIMAAEEDSPIAQTAPSPRYPAAPAAR